MLSLTAAKAHLRVTTDTEDDLIGRLVSAARAHLEAKTGLYLGEATERSVFLAGNGFGSIWLADTPQGAVTVTEHVLPGDDGTALEETDFRLVGRKLIRLGGLVWTDGYEYEVTLPIGYTWGDDYSDAPAGLVQAQAMLVAHWFENREAVSTVTAEVEQGVSELIAPYIPLPI